MVVERSNHCWQKANYEKRELRPRGMAKASVFYISQAWNEQGRQSRDDANRSLGMSAEIQISLPGSLPFRPAPLFAPQTVGSRSPPTTTQDQFQSDNAAGGGDNQHRNEGGA